MTELEKILEGLANINDYSLETDFDNDEIQQLLEEGIIKAADLSQWRASDLLIDGIIDYLSEANHDILVGFSEQNRLKAQEQLANPFHSKKFEKWTTLFARKLKKKKFKKKRNLKRKRKK